MIKVLLILSYFLSNSSLLLDAFKKGEPCLHGWPDKQISGNVSTILQHFYFDEQSEKILEAFQKLELFNFFCWLEYYWC